MEKNSKKSGVSINSIINLLFGAAITLAICVTIALIGLYNANKSIVGYTHEYNQCDEAVDELRTASEYLTQQSRLFVETGNINYMKLYGNEISNTRRREEAVDTLNEHNIDLTKEDFYKQAADYSNDMEKLEIHALRLAAEAYGNAESSGVIPEVSAYELTNHEKALSNDEKLAAARTLLYSKTYTTYQDAFSNNIKRFHQSILEQLDSRTDEATKTHNRLIIVLIAFSCVFFTVVFFAFISLREALLNPLLIYMDCIEQGLKLPPRGAKEMQKLADVFNEMYESIE